MQCGSEKQLPNSANSCLDGVQRSENEVMEAPKSLEHFKKWCFDDAEKSENEVWRAQNLPTRSELALKCRSGIRGDYANPIFIGDFRTFLNDDLDRKNFRYGHVLPAEAPRAALAHA